MECAGLLHSLLHMAMAVGDRGRNLVAKKLCMYDFCSILPPLQAVEWIPLPQANKCWTQHG